MFKKLLSNPQEFNRLLTHYLPHGVQVVVQPEADAEPVVGVLEDVDFVDFSGPARLRVCISPDRDKWCYPLATEVRPLLYTLADLPHLPDDTPDFALRTLVRRLDILASEDYGAGEYVRDVTVEHASPGELRLQVSTGYVSYSPGYEDRDGEWVESESEEVGPGSDYQVVLRGYGDIEWRPVPTAPDQRELFRSLSGSRVLAAFNYLRGLHVAVLDALDEYGWRYVRKPLPLPQEGGVNNG